MMNRIISAIDNGILFLCVANSARSQIAEGLAREMFGPSVRVQSAGSKPARVHPLAVEVMKEIGIDISSQRAKSISDVDMSRVSLVVTLCTDEVCAIRTSPSIHLHWFLPNPAIHKAGYEDIDSFRKTRDELKLKIGVLYKQYNCVPVRTINRNQAPALSGAAGFFAPFRKLTLRRVASAAM